MKNTATKSATSQICKPLGVIAKKRLTITPQFLMTSAVRHNIKL